MRIEPFGFGKARIVLEHVFADFRTCSVGPVQIGAPYGDFSVLIFEDKFVIVEVCIQEAISKINADIIVLSNTEQHLVQYFSLNAVGHLVVLVAEGKKLFGAIGEVDHLALQRLGVAQHKLLNS